jgi:uncharacterized membrane protein
MAFLTGAFFALFRLKHRAMVERMDRFWQSEPQWLIVWLAAAAALAAVGLYVIGKIRPKPAQKERFASQWLSKCRESHSQGKLTDEEYRTIKTKLNSRLQEELSDSGEKD